MPKNQDPITPASPERLPGAPRASGVEEQILRIKILQMAIEASDKTINAGQLVQNAGTMLDWVKNNPPKSEGE
jgi:hypothetical protein